MNSDKNQQRDNSQTLPINAENPEAYSNRGLLRTYENDRWGAMQDYNQALQLDPNHITTYINRSVLRLELADYHGAIADCNAILKINPNYPEAYLNRGLAYLELDNYQKAMEDYNSALQINPHLAEVYFNRGLNRVALGEYQNAIADFTQAIEINPNYTQAYLNRGYTRLHLGENWGTIEDFDCALRLDSVAAQAFFNQINHVFNDDIGEQIDKNKQLIQGILIQGNLRYELGDYQSAIDNYTKVLNLDPNNIEAYNRRSTVRSGMGDYKGAMEDLEKATNLCAVQEQSLAQNAIESVQITAKKYHQLGVNKLRKGDFYGAISEFNAVLEINSNDATALTCRGFAYRRIGDNRRAIVDLQMAAKLFDEQGDIKSAQEIVNTLKKLQS